MATKNSLTVLIELMEQNKIRAIEPSHDDLAIQFHGSDEWFSEAEFERDSHTRRLFREITRLLIKTGE